jgi:hypothetical protein
MARIGGGKVGGGTTGTTTTTTTAPARTDPPSAVGGWPDMAAVTGTFNAAGASFRLPFRVPFACTNLRLTFAAWTYNESTQRETALGNTLPIKVAIEYAGATYPLYFGGTRAPVLDSGAQAQTDPFGLTLPTGAEGWIRIFVNAGTGQVPQGVVGGGPGVTSTGSWVDGSDVCDNTGAMTTATLPNGVPSPVAVTAVPLTTTPPATILCIGDDVPAGYGWTYASWSASNPNSWFTRWTNSTVGAQRLCGKNDQLSFWATPGRAGRRLAMARGFSHALIYLGSNDLYMNRTLAQMQTDYTSLVQTLKGLGCQVIGATVTVRSNTGSTDSWATTTNQSPHNSEPTRVAFNDWLRSKPAALGLASVLEIADIVETARNSGLWKVNGTANYMTNGGLYPTTTGHQLIATSLPAIGTVVTTGAAPFPG